MTFIKMKNLLPRAIERSGNPDGLGAALVLDLWNKVAVKIIGEEAKKTKAFRLQSGTLYIRVPSPLWAQELHLHSPQLIDELNKEIGKRTVVKLWTRLRSK
ncbi:MAG: DUF721 domain-containing protein [Patescibacteria group bacterium]|nr:DUF721 domain-containing protein [Patescibacteria group bacterium]